MQYICLRWRLALQNRAHEVYFSPHIAYRAAVCFFFELYVFVLNLFMQMTSSQLDNVDNRISTDIKLLTEA